MLHRSAFINLLQFLGSKAHGNNLRWVCSPARTATPTLLESGDVIAAFSLSRPTNNLRLGNGYTLYRLTHGIIVLRIIFVHKLLVVYLYAQYHQRIEITPQCETTVIVADGTRITVEPPKKNKK